MDTTLPASATELLLTVAEPTRLRILNCLAAAPLFVSDLQAVLDQFVLYRLRRDGGGHGRLLSAILDAVVHDDPDKRAERERASERSRSHTKLRVEDPPPGDKPLTRAKRPG